MTPTPDTGSNFVNDRHALYVGWVLGIARENGLDVWPTMDEAGNYTDRIMLHLDAETFTIKLVVPPPPDDWNPE